MVSEVKYIVSNKKVSFHELKTPTELLPRKNRCIYLLNGGFIDAAMKYCDIITGCVVPNAPRRAEDSPPYSPYFIASQRVVAGAIVSHTTLIYETLAKLGRAACLVGPRAL